MSLRRYHQKRDFKKTAEPKGKVAKAKKNKLLYIIQKHAASHLHYDFRLELNGVLLSWAVPKGPSLDPSVKRLAMHVEDHPVEYGSFQGIIPKGEYGGGTVMLWDKGEWISEDDDPTKAYHSGNMTFVLKGKKLKGRWKLIRINYNDKTWLLIKIKDDYAKSSKTFDITRAEPNSVLNKQSLDEIADQYEHTWDRNGLKKRKDKPVKKKPLKSLPTSINLPRTSFPKIIYPQLATLVDAPPRGENWLYEIKFDGYRLIAFKKGSNVKLFTRNNNDWTAKFKKIADEIQKLPVTNLILDGEIVVLDKEQHSDFQLLQNSMQEGGAEFYLYIFDLLYYDHFNLMGMPLLERKKILESLINHYQGKNLIYSDHILGSGEEIFKNACELGLEGIIAKQKNSMYAQGRNKDWLKIKCTQRQEFVIGGFLASDKRNFFRSLLLGFYNKKGELIYCGNVGTGFTQQSLHQVYQQLIKEKTDQMPFGKKPPNSKKATWVKPILVAEIEFSEWTDSGTLRHPSFKGMRKDKPSKSITKEKEMPIKKIAAKKSVKPKKKIKNEAESKITHPEKILYPESKITKNDLANYYETIQDWILPHIINRPLTFVRCPEDYRTCFYQKHITHKPPAGLYGIMIKEKEGKDRYIYLQDVEGLLALSQMSVLEIHPWGSLIDNIEYPDRIVFDLDPAPGVPWKRVVEAALEVKDILKTIGLKSFVKTTGGKGLHVVVPVKPEYEWEDVKKFSHVLVEFLVMNNADRYIAKMSKAARKNKIFIDYHRNTRGATAVSAYSTRARLHAPVSTPLAWDELTNDRDDTHFTLKTLPKRLNSLRKDPWHDFFKIKQSLKLDKLKL